MADLNAKFLNYEGLKSVFELIKGQYATKSSFDEVYTKSQVDELIKQGADLKEYAKTAEVVEMLESYATIDSLNGFFDKAEYVKDEHAIKFYHGEEEIEASKIDCNDFIVSGIIKDAKIEGTDLVITFDAEDGDKTVTVSLADIFQPENYYQKSEVDTLLNTKLDKSTYTTDKGTFLTKNEAAATYMKIEDMPSLSDYATQTWVKDQGYLKSAALDAYYTKTAVDAKLAALDFSSELTDYAKTEEVNEKLADYAKKVEIENFIDGAEYVKAEKAIKFYHGEEEVDSIDCNDFIISGILESAEVTEDKKLKLVFTSGEEVEIDLDDLIDIENYYDKDAVDEKLSKKLDEAVFNTKISDYLTSNDAEAIYAKKSDIPSTTGFVTTEVLESYEYVTKNALESDYYNKEQVDNALKAINVSDQLKDYAKTAEVAETYVAKADVLSSNDIQNAFNEALGL